MLQKTIEVDGAQIVLNGIDAIDWEAFGLIFIGVLFGVLLYFLPTFIAFLRKNQNRIEVFVINLLLGWSIFGWFVALILSFKRN